jgi:hypothetical protein
VGKGINGLEKRTFVLREDGFIESFKRSLMNMKTTLGEVVNSFFLIRRRRRRDVKQMLIQN